nr:zinc finger, CCHC-type [Tanacetum cinerariifolium]
MNHLRVWGCRVVVRLPDPKLKTLGERGIECIFVRYGEHSKAFMFYVIEPNDSITINTIIELRDAIFNEHRDEISDQQSYCFNVDDDPKTFNESMKSQNVILWKEATNIIGNNTWVLTNLPPGCRPLGCKCIYKRKLKMDVKTAFLNGELEEEVYMNQPLGLIMSGHENKSHYLEKVLKNFNHSDCTRVSTPMDTCEKLMPNKGQAVSQLEYSRVIGCLMYAMNYTRHDISFDVGKLRRLVYSGYPSVLEGYTDASKKQTCITGSTMESEFVALAAAGKEVEWLKNLLIEIPLWVKPIAPIFIYYDSAATLAKAYSHMFNGKSRHLGVKHIMIRELITNRVMTEAHILQIIPRMCLKPTDKEDEVANFSMVKFFEKLLSKSINKEEPPISGAFKCLKTYVYLPSGVAERNFLVICKVDAWIKKTDACGTCIRGVLQQKGHPNAYLSKALYAKHQSYSTYEKEFLAVILALEKWRGYLMDKHFKIKTHHFSLKYLLDQRVTTPFQAKWLPKLLGYDYDISYKKGSENVVGDALSRVPSGNDKSQMFSLITTITTSPLWEQIKDSWERD